jgi:hypothetical protein
MSHTYTHRYQTSKLHREQVALVWRDETTSSGDLTRGVHRGFSAGLVVTNTIVMLRTVYSWPAAIAGASGTVLNIAQIEMGKKSQLRHAQTRQMWNA